MNSRQTEDGPRYWPEWSEELGDVLWWKWPIQEAPYVGTPNDLGHTVEVGFSAKTSGAGRGICKADRIRVGGWPFGDEEDERRECLWFTPLPDAGAIDQRIRDEIRGGPDPLAHPQPE